MTATQKGYANTLDSMEEMDQFLEPYNLLRLNQEEIEDLNRPITSDKTDSQIKNLPANKSLGPDGVTGEFYQTFKEKLILIFLRLLQVREEGGMQISSGWVFLFMDRGPNCPGAQWEIEFGGTDMLCISIVDCGCMIIYNHQS